MLIAFVHHPLNGNIPKLLSPPLPFPGFCFPVFIFTYLHLWEALSRVCSKTGNNRCFPSSNARSTSSSSSPFCFMLCFDGQKKMVEWYHFVFECPM